MTLLEYYKKYLNENIVKVEPLYFSMNLTNDTSGIEFWDRVVYEDGNTEYYPSVSEYDHNLTEPFNMPNEWLSIGVVSNFDEDIPEDVAERLSTGRGW